MKIIDNLTQSRKVFFECVDLCNRAYRHGEDLAFYRDLVYQHRTTNSLETLINSEGFLLKLYATLEKWDMNKRGARLVDYSTMQDSIKSFKEELCELYKYRLEIVSAEEIQSIRKQLEILFCGLKVMATSRRIVGASKALHFLLPDLVLPIDSSYTMPAFYGYNRYESGEGREFKTFFEIINKSRDIAIRLKLCNSDVDGILWSCSVPKLIDNAIIGFFIKAKESLKQDLSTLKT